jgi:hypothetical protein
MEIQAQGGEKAGQSQGKTTQKSPGKITTGYLNHRTGTSFLPYYYPPENVL